VRVGKLADQSETDKCSDERNCSNHHCYFSVGESAVFVPVGVDIASGLGNEARTFYKQSAASSGRTSTTTSSRATESPFPSSAA
jgi:hypothetical protein